MDIKSYIKENLINALKSLGIENPKVIIEKPKDPLHGDYSCNAAMIYAKKFSKNPVDFAYDIISQLNARDEYISKTSVAGQGFINFFISDSFYKGKINEIIQESDNYGKLNDFYGKTANIEWVSANPTGPLHTGHGRQLALGKAIANLLEQIGYKVTREYYYNNAGNQMNVLAESVYARYRKLFEPEFPFPENGYQGNYIYQIAETLKNEYGDKLIDSDKEIFKQSGENFCFKSIKQTLQKFDISFDVFFNESSLYDSGKIDAILNEFKQKNLSYKKDGAVWLKTSELIDKKGSADKVILKATGEPTYRLPDMAYHIDKINRKYDLIIDIFGADHSDTYQEVLAGIKALGYDITKIKVIIHQMVTFIKEGKPVKMSKRSDNIYTLDDLVNDVGADVAQFFFIMRSPNTHLEFDLNLAKEQSDKNPVYYLQYAHARICSILRNAYTVFPDYSKNLNFNINLLNDLDEINLIKILSEFPEAVRAAAYEFEPHKIINYLNSVAENFHKFYHNNRVIDSNNVDLSYARLKLCEAAKIVLKNGFKIIGISAPERM